MSNSNLRKFKVWSVWTWTYEKADFSYGYETVFDAKDELNAKWLSEARFPPSLIWPGVERKLSQIVTEL